MRIVLDPGHGGADPGAVNERLRLRESAIALVYAEKLRRVLYELSHSVFLTRDSDRTLSLAGRVAYANEQSPKAGLFLSIHCNAAANPSAQGIEVFTSIGQTASDECATMLFDEIKRAFPDRKVRAGYEDGDPDKEANFYVLRKTLMPAVLLELGFISNDSEALWLTELQTLERYCDVIARGLNAWAETRR